MSGGMAWCDISILSGMMIMTSSIEVGAVFVGIILVVVGLLVKVFQ